MKYLLLTVGGSYQPLVRAITTLEPDHVVFLCSKDTTEGKGSYTQVTGAGLVCGGRPGQPADQPCIPAQTGLAPDQYNLSIYDIDPDDLSDCYSKCANVIQQIRANDSQANIYADYTGSTKSMSAGLACAALDDGKINIMLVTGFRPNLVAVQDGCEFLTRAKVESVILLRIKKEINRLLKSYDYASAEKVLRVYLSDTTNNMVSEWLAICKAFDAWDRFDHKSAIKFLNSTKKYPKHIAFLGKLEDIITADAGKVEDKDAVEPNPKIGFMLVTDILANARRRASQGRYDDAIGRHYRAVELIAQTLLLVKCGIKTSECPVAEIPAEWMWKIDEGQTEIKLGLMKSWELTAYKCPEIAEQYKLFKSQLLSAIERRNMSLFAHGTVPINKQDYEDDVKNGMAAFADMILKIIAKDKKITPPDMFSPDFVTELE